MARSKKPKALPRRLLVQMVADLSKRLQAQRESAEDIAQACKEMAATGPSHSRIIALVAGMHAADMIDVAGFAEIIASRAKGA
jgi:hypothetical protein